MVHREDSSGLIVITQPAHAWVAAQFGRAWGNGTFPAPAPTEEVCLAAALHDQGFAPWEQSPTLDPKTGRPRDFMSMPSTVHLDLWADSVVQALQCSRYAALLVSLHVAHLCRLPKQDDKPRDAQAVQGFLDQQHAIQSELRAALGNDAVTAGYLAEDEVNRQQRLLAAWDWMSLAVCQGLTATTVEAVPTGEGLTILSMEAGSPARDVYRVAPWPFGAKSVEVRCEGRRLTERFTDEAAMRLALREAEVVPLRVRLVPG